MSVDDNIIKILQNQFIIRIDDAYRDNAVEDFKVCVRQIRRLFLHINLEQYQTITVFSGLIPSLKGKGKVIAIENIHSVPTDNLVVNFVNENQTEIIQDSNFDLVDLSAHTFIYQWSAREKNADQFFVNGEKIPFSEEVTPCEGSFFSVRTYNDLDEALINYRDNVALMCRGRALMESMTLTRMFFNPAPEELLQEALCEYLENRLRQCDVKREHNVDTSHPVDIIIKWRGTNHNALIEIKWIGASLKDGQISIKYAGARANEGAKQLIGYIDDNQDSFPRDVTVGYLVVYDLRRRHNNDPASEKISRANANYYKDKEIDYHPQYELTRKDFKRPYRFFIKVNNDAYQD